MTSPDTFEPGKSYLIETLPDDLDDKSLCPSKKWALRGALFWNDCQGWWHEAISDYWLQCKYHDGHHIARFWSPEPRDPMTREEVLAERGMVVCPICDYATGASRSPCATNCRERTNDLT